MLRVPLFDERNGQFVAQVVLVGKKLYERDRPKNFDCFKEEETYKHNFYKKFAMLDTRSTTLTITTKQRHKQHDNSSHEAYRIIKTLKEDNTRLKEELKTKQEVINRIMGNLRKETYETPPINQNSTNQPIARITDTQAIQQTTRHQKEKEEIH